MRDKFIQRPNALNKRKSFNICEPGRVNCLMATFRFKSNNKLKAKHKDM